MQTIKLLTEMGCILVTKAGAVSFRYNYRLHGRQETLVLGRYGPGGLTLLEARERFGEARKKLSVAESPSRLKARHKLNMNEQENFATWAMRWFDKYRMAESTRDMRRSVYERDLARPFGRLLLAEITHDELRALCDRIVERGAPATAVHAREIVTFMPKTASRDRPVRSDSFWPLLIDAF
jgi:hypothetical protein